jgi:TonB family protein
MTKAAPFGLVMAVALLGPTAVAQPAGLASAVAEQLKLVSYESPSVPTLGTDGSAIVAFTIRADGRVADAVTLVASDRRLAEPARQAVLQWRFERDSVLGRGRDARPDAVLRREVVEFVFKRDKVTGMNHRDGAKAWFPEDRRFAVRTVPSSELDAPLVRRSAPAGDGAGESLSGFRVHGRAIVNFVVDETGTVRVPAVETADAPELAEAALAVVARWSYEPPVEDGRPVLAEERTSLTFQRPQP